MQTSLFDGAMRPDIRPGSPEAKAAGCKCSGPDNHHGKGFARVHPDNGWDHAEWVIRTDCRLHWRKP